MILIVVLAATLAASPRGEAAVPAPRTTPPDTAVASAPAPADTARASAPANSLSGKDSLGITALPAPSAATTPAGVAPDPRHYPMRLVAVATIAGKGSGQGQVLEPAGVATDAFGKVYVSDAALHRVQRFDEHGAWLGESGSLGSGAGQLRKPGSIAAIGTVSVAVLDTENRRVLSYDLFGQLRGTLVDFEDPAIADALGRVDPIALAADRGGAFFVADADRDRLLAFDSSGGYVRSIGGYGTRPGSFRGIAGLAVGRHGDILVAERLNARMQRLDPAGRVLESWPLVVTGKRGSLGLAVDDSGHVAIADEAGGRLRVLDRGGAPLASLEGLEGARALAFARDGTLIVAESTAGTVRRFRLERNTEVLERRGE